MNDTDTAYVCRECGEAFAPTDMVEWGSLKRDHKIDCEGATFRRTTVAEAF